MLLSAMSVLVVAQSSSEFPEGLMNNPVYTVASLRSVVFLYKGEQDVNVARRISVVPCNWITAPTKRGVGDESRICKDNLSSTSFFTETVGTALLVLSVREAFLE